MADDPLNWLAEEWQRWQQAGLARESLVRTGPQSGLQIEVAGRALVNFGSNDYLGLANDPRLKAAAETAIEQVGLGAGASPLVTGRGIWHEQLEASLAQLEAAQRALLFPTGFAANAGTIPALVGSGDAIFSDAKNHASIIDGCRLSGAQLHIYRHADPQHLSDLLRTSPPTRRRLIATDGLFSMDGDIAPLPEIVALAEHYGAMTLVDEAHATGVFGKHGRGCCEYWGVEDRVSVRIGTLSKALGSAGGFAVGSAELIEWLRNRSRTYMFSTAMPEALSAAACTALQIVQDEPQRRVQLLSKAADFRRQLAEQGFQTGTSASQIVPIILGGATPTMEVAQRLRENGFFVPGIRPPSVPDGESLLRLSLTADHDSAVLQGLLSVLNGLVAR